MMLCAVQPEIDRHTADQVELTPGLGGSLPRTLDAGSATDQSAMLWVEVAVDAEGNRRSCGKNTVRLSPSLRTTVNGW